MVRCHHLIVVMGTRYLGGKHVILYLTARMERMNLNVAPMKVIVYKALELVYFIKVYSNRLSIGNEVEIQQLGISIPTTLLKLLEPMCSIFFFKFRLIMSPIPFVTRTLLVNNIFVFLILFLIL